ncbi:MAG: hypothetical protein LBQ54_13775 [Planctomycetaceae bacterium]|jgi:hypothetical protein|nr:hypothetical protein [Planctomycetaceae bacterium]
MKKDRHHQLIQNDLARHIGKKYETLKQHSAKIYLAVIGALLILAVYLIWQSVARRNQAEFSQDISPAVLFGVEEVSQLAPMLQKYPAGDENARFLLIAAEMSLMEANTSLRTDRSEAAKKLEDALEKFTAAKSSAKSPFLTDRVQWGLARTHEMLATLREGQDMEEAKKWYESLASEDGSVFQQLAKDQLTALNRSWTPVFATASINDKPREPLAPDLTMPEPGATSPNVDVVLGLDSNQEDKTEEEKTEKTENVTVPEAVVPEVTVPEAAIPETRTPETE